MERKNINPDTLLTPRGYSHVVSIEGAQKLAFIAGQVAVDKEGKLVGAGDLTAQIKQVAHNLIAALAAAGAKPSDIVKMNTYIVNYKPTDYGDARGARDSFSRWRAACVDAHRRAVARGRRAAGRDRGNRRNQVS
jgi:enamine deaminase RidA (YjgF/YER057c/UK114 family)